MARKKPEAPQTGAPSDRLSLRIDLAGGTRIGPGKVAVLEEIDRSGSISAAGRALKMSYRRTWALVEELNTGLGTPMLETSSGGQGGGGARLTPAGRAVIAAYRNIAAACAQAASDHLQELNQALTPGA